ncbi:MAG: CapA family protein, partial [Armatimonadota bacterium]|nr:CapA family protein [Armatimonadota bacterium]
MKNTSLVYKGTRSENRPSRTVVVFVAGDVMMGRGVAFQLHQQQTPLQWLAPQSRSADLAFCNLECVLIAKLGAQQSPHQLLASPDTVHYLRAAGIDIVSLANNHSFDAGEVGVRTTLQTLQKAGIVGIGTGSGNGSWPAWEKTIGNRHIAWLAASAYGPWRKGRTQMRNIAGSGLTDQVRSLTQGGDAVFVSLHWGNEFSRTPTSGQKELAHRLIDAGAIAIVGHHPHVVQPVEVYRGKPIFYSLGNFVFDRLPGRTQDGLAACISLLPSGVVRFHTLPLRSPQQGNLGPELRSLSLSRPPKAPMAAGEKLVKMLPGRFVKREAAPQVVVWSRNRSGQDVLRAFVRRSGGWR